MRVALVAESFLPHMNGVTGSVLQVLTHLSRGGHEVLVIAPQSPETIDAVDAVHTELLRSVPMPSYPQVRLVFARAARIGAILSAFQPDVVHLASPFVLGWQALVAADRLGIPTVAIYQTDVISYARKYGVPQATALVEKHVTRLHRRATLTLAPSSASIHQLQELGVDRLRLWGRGVDAERFAPERRSESWRAKIAPGEVIVGYVGRLAPEKQVEDLQGLAGIRGTRLVIVGDGPSRAALQKQLPDAVFLGHLAGMELAEAVASFDVFVHTGESETFGQTIQEALASGVPVVATGRGGPVDLVHSSVDGWLYRPGDLADLRDRVNDLVGDELKRRAFGQAAREGVRDRTWHALVQRLVEHYSAAISLHAIDEAMWARAARRPEPQSLTADLSAPRWSRFVALGDSLTEGLCDSSRMPAGQFRGWADRLAQLLAHAGGDAEPFRYANLAVRSRRVRDLEKEQIDGALRLKPDLVAVFMGANDLIGHRANPVTLAQRVRVQVERLRASGADVLLVTPFLPRRRAARVFARSFAIFASELRIVAEKTGAILLDVEAFPAMSDLEMWAEDKVHLRSRGHRFLAYRAAELLGVRDAEALAGLDAAFHVDDDDPNPHGWIRRHALPWIWRRLHGRTAGDGLVAKHRDYIEIPRRGTGIPVIPQA